MSVVSGIILAVSCAEDMTGVDSDRPELFDVIDAWLGENHRPGATLTQFDQDLGGGKAPQFYSAGAGFNAFSEDAFAAFVMGLPWLYPENFVLIIQPEDGPTRVFTIGAELQPGTYRQEWSNTAPFPEGT